MSEKTFKLGDKVAWQSQSQGAWKEKVGTIVAVIPPKTQPNRQQFPSLFSGAGPGSGRHKESFIVEVPHPGPRAGKPRIFWPHVGLLTAHE